MTIRGRRIFNNRPMVFCALALCLGIISGEAFFGVDARFRFIPLVALICVSVLLVCLKKFKKLVYLPIAVIVGFVAICGANDLYSKRSYRDCFGVITARVASEVLVEDGKTSFYADSIKIDGDSLYYRARVYIAYELEPDFSVGDIVELRGSLKSNKHVAFSTDYGYFVANRLGYTLNAHSVTLQSKNDAPFLMRLRHKIKKLFYENTDGYTASICQALILGDKTGIDDGFYANISASGLAHVLAVSGLHIATLSDALYFMLKKLKVNPKISFAVVCVVTFLYSMLCSFSASSLRAFIMCATFAFADVFSRKKDKLSTLAFSAIIILLFRPTALFEVGFLLSYYAVTGIFLFYKPLNRAGMKLVNKISPKRQIGKRVSQACAISLSTNIVTFPLVAHFFKAVPTLFIIANVIVLPYVMAMFVVLIVLTLLSLITGFGGFVWLMQILFIPFRLYVAGVGNLSFASVPAACSTVAIVGLSLLFVLCSEYIFLQKSQKVRLVSIGLTITVLTSTLIYLC